MDKKYKIFFLSVYDEYIEEENAAGCCLTKAYVDQEAKKYNIWTSGIAEWDIKKILSEVWSKEDVDMFISLYPENTKYEFRIYKEEYQFGGKNWEYYCPLKEKRHKKITDVLSSLS